MATTRNELENYITELFDLDRVEDYGPNGLQIEGSDKINKLAFAVSATADSVKKAVDAKADGLVVHHGLFWKFHGARTITGPFAKRIKPLIQNDMNLFGIHLPLDGHLKIGNARSIADKLELVDIETFGEYKKTATGIKGKFKKPITALKLKQSLESVLEHSILMASPDENEKISSVGIITGGANGGWKDAIDHQLDSYITGEMSEHDWHESAEHGIHMFAGGHNATERFGIQNLMTKIENDFKVECLFIGSDNPA